MALLKRYESEADQSNLYPSNLSQSKRLVWMCVGVASCATAVAQAGLVTGDSPGGGPDVYGDYVIDLSGLVVNGTQGDALNPVMDLTGGDGQQGFISEYVIVSAVMWDVNFESSGFAWLSDLRLGITVNAGTAEEERVLIGPAFGDDMGGQGAYASSGWVNLFSMDMGMYVGMDNTIRVEAFSAFAFPFGGIEFGEGSTLTLGLQVPEPGAVPVVMLAGFIAARRRR